MISSGNGILPGYILLIILQHFSPIFSEDVRSFGTQSRMIKHPI